MRHSAITVLAAVALVSVAIQASAQQLTNTVNPPAAFAIQDNGCLKAPAVRPIWCFPHHPRGFATAAGAYGARPNERQLERQRQAFLERRYRGYDRR